MRRLIILLFLSAFSFGVYAQYAKLSYSVIAHRQYDTPDSYLQSQYSGMYQTSSHAVNYHDRVSANTFSSIPSMEITTILPTQVKDKSGYDGHLHSSGIRPPQRGIDGEDQEDVDDGDLTEPDIYDPNATPLGNTPWLLMTVLALGYALRKRAILC